MTRQTATTAVVAILISAFAANVASAQVIAYRHRSTAYGDYMAGYAEAVNARGLADRNHAIAYRTYIQAERERAALNYEYAQARLYLKEQRLEGIRQKADLRREALDQQSMAEDLAAQQLLTEVHRGVHQWPEALRRPEFTQSMNLIQSVLRGWAPDGTTADNAYRKALMTEAAVLKNKVATSSDIDYLDRQRAVQTLTKVARLAKMDAVDITAGSLAMR